MGYVLKRLNKKYDIILNEPPQEKYNYLYGIDEIKVAEDLPTKEYNNVITLDVPALSRIADVERFLAEEAFIINIDHHSDNTSFGNYNICNIVSSTTEVLYDIIKELGIEFDKDLAEMIYTGIIYDTGMFRFSLTTEKAYLISAEMKKAGASLDKVAETVYFSKDPETIMLLAQTLMSLKTYENGRIGIIVAKISDIKKMCTKKPDLDDYVNYLMMINGIEVGAFLIEMDEKFYRVSLRSKNDFDVQKVASSFSGGGHKKAAGCRLVGNSDEVTFKLITEIKKYLPNASKD